MKMTLKNKGSRAIFALLLVLLCMPAWRVRPAAAARVIYGANGFRMVAVPLPQTGSVPVGQTNGTPHGITLFWNPGAAVSGVTVAGFNAFRATTSGAEAGTPAINGSTVITATTTSCPTGMTSPCNTYVDSTVTPGQTYFYKVDAKSTTGNQSALSAEASATVPQNPSSPGTPVVAGQ